MIHLGLGPFLEFAVNMFFTRFVTFFFGSRFSLLFERIVMYVLFSLGNKFLRHWSKYFIFFKVDANCRSYCLLTAVTDKTWKKINLKYKYDFKCRCFKHIASIGTKTVLTWSPKVIIPKFWKKGKVDQSERAQTKIHAVHWGLFRALFLFSTYSLYQPYKMRPYDKFGTVFSAIYFMPSDCIKIFIFVFLGEF